MHYYLVYYLLLLIITRAVKGYLTSQSLVYHRFVTGVSRRICLGFWLWGLDWLVVGLCWNSIVCLNMLFQLIRPNNIIMLVSFSNIISASSWLLSKKVVHTKMIEDSRVIECYAQEPGIVRVRPNHIVIFTGSASPGWKVSPRISRPGMLCCAHSYYAAWSYGQFSSSQRSDVNSCVSNPRIMTCLDLNMPFEISSSRVSPILPQWNVRNLLHRCSHRNDLANNGAVNAKQTWTCLLLWEICHGLRRQKSLDSFHIQG